MKLPTFLIIGSEVWAIKRRWNLTHRRQPVHGPTDPTERTIWLDRKLNKDEIMPTLIHEILHAILEEYSLGHNAPNQLDTDQEENIVDALQRELSSIFTFKLRKDA